MQLSPVGEDILVALLLVGDSLPITIAEVTGPHPGSVSRTMPDLVDAGLVVEKHRSVYALTPEGYAAARGILRRRADDEQVV
jgi:Mn-dependent DtxR family transcriptional regulator